MAGLFMQLVDPHSWGMEHMEWWFWTWGDVFYWHLIDWVGGFVVRWGAVI